MYLRDTWYVAAWADEIGEAPLLDIHGDAARIHARRVVEQLIAAEQVGEARGSNIQKRAVAKQR